RSAATRVDLIELSREQLTIAAEVRNHLNVVAKTDNRDLVLRAGGAQEVASSLANEVHSLLDAARYVEQQHEVERLIRRSNVSHTAFDAVFPNRKVRLAHAADRAPVTIRNTRIESHQLRRHRSNNPAGRRSALL